MRLKKNILATWLTKEMKARPHYIEYDNWLAIKQIAADYKECMVNSFLDMQFILSLDRNINSQLNEISNRSGIEQTYECDEHIFNMLDFYIDNAVELELFETAQNLNMLRDYMCVKVIA